MVTIFLMISKQLFLVYKYFVFPVQWPQSKRPLPISGSCHLCSVLLLLSIVNLHHPFYFSTESRDLATTFSFSRYIYEVLPLHILGNPIHISSHLFPLYNLISPSDTVFHFLELQNCINSKCLGINPWISQASVCSNSAIGHTLNLYI